MVEILRFIITYCYRLFNPHKFKIVDSETSNSSGHGGWILLASEDVQFYFALERNVTEELVVWIGSTHDTRQNKWYSFDLIRDFLTGETCHTGIMNADNGSYLENNIDTIIGMFGKESYPGTAEKLDQAKIARTEQLWGEGGE